jgi:hypothetical protein
MILGLGSSLFKAMFTSNLKEGFTQQSGVTIIPALDWQTYDSLFLFLLYFYTGR